jgi:hypothetical protein
MTEGETLTQEIIDRHKDEIQKGFTRSYSDNKTPPPPAQEWKETFIEGDEW